MPPDLPNEQALILKKRARRRLVGAIALVLLMIIILPRILQDRANQTTQESIKITMPAESAETFSSAVTPLESPSPIVTEPVVDESASITQKTEAEIENLAAQQAEPVIKPPVKNATVSTAKAEIIKPEQVKPESKPLKPVDSAKDAGFTVQVGVFSDAANVKQLQEKLKQAGFSSYTEKIATPGGQKIRLRAGKFATRQEASDALNTIKSAGLSGMVISN
jgi:DedD protein